MCKIPWFVSRFMCDATVVDLISNAVLTYRSDISAGNSIRPLIQINYVLCYGREEEKEKKKINAS